MMLFNVTEPEHFYRVFRESRQAPSSVEAFLRRYACDCAERAQSYAGKELKLFPEVAEANRAAIEAARAYVAGYKSRHETEQRKAACYHVSTAGAPEEVRAAKWAAVAASSWSPYTARDDNWDAAYAASDAARQAERAAKEGGGQDAVEEEIYLQHCAIAEFLSSC